MPSTLPTVSRRRVLLGATALALLSGTVATACGSTPPVQEVDALVAQLERANDDSRLAAAAAAAAPPKTAAALTLVAQQRAAHAKALTEEITRFSGETPTTSATATTESSPSSPTTTSGPPPKPPTVADVVAALKQSADGATLLATQQSGYRAGLLGSITAACTASGTVALANVGPAT
ncbi:MAG: hypothetical protein JWR11_3818 [Mycobacterium sp.]|nr:hypothetical protein [Mycobacterium sp.]